MHILEMHSRIGDALAATLRLHEELIHDAAVLKGSKRAVEIRKAQEAEMIGRDLKLVHEALSGYTNGPGEVR